MKLKSILYFISTILFASCASKYEKVDEQWTWKTHSEAGDHVKKLTVDNASFKILSNKIYAKDKHKVFIHGSEIKGADPVTFKILSKDEYARDKDRIYLGTSIVVSADPATFKVLEWPYAKDKTHVFCGNIPMKISAIDEFRVTKSTEHKSYYPTSLFIKQNKDYEWLDTVESNGVVVGEISEGETSSEKFRGFSKIE